MELHTFPEPEQFRHLLVVGAFKGRSVALVTMGSMDTHSPLAEHRAHDKYPII